MQTKTITITSIEQKTYSNGSVVSKIKDENNLTYTLFHSWQNQPTIPYTKLRNLTNGGLNQIVNVSFKAQEVNKKDGTGTYTSRTIQDIEQATGETSNVATPNSQPASVINQAKPDWDNINAEKRKDIKWMNAINNACLLMSSDKSSMDNDELLRTRLKSLCNWIYTLEPNKVPNQPQNAPQTPNMDNNEPSGYDPNEEIKVENIPF